MAKSKTKRNQKLEYSPFNNGPASDKGLAMKEQLNSESKSTNLEIPGSTNWQTPESEDEISGASDSSMPLCKRIDPQVKPLIDAGMNSEEIGRQLGVQGHNVRGTPTWKAHVANQKQARQPDNDSDKPKKKVRRKYGSISIPRVKADVIDNLKQSGARLKDELMRSPNSYQCNYFLIKREAETICALLERFFVEE